MYLSLSIRAANKWQFDWRQLQRWGISESKLPRDSEIRFRDPSLWDTHRLLILGIAAALIVQAAIIFGLIYEHRRRSVAEVESRNAMAELANMNRLATAGQLSGSIAHEINQPVAGMVLNASAALRTDRWASRRPSHESDPGPGAAPVAFRLGLGTHLTSRPAA